MVSYAVVKRVTEIAFRNQVHALMAEWFRERLKMDRSCLSGNSNLSARECQKAARGVASCELEVRY